MSFTCVTTVYILEFLFIYAFSLTVLTVIGIPTHYGSDEAM